MVNVSMLLIAISIGMTFGIFAYNMTQQLENETRLLNACIVFNLDLPQCDAIYGGTPESDVLPKAYGQGDGEDPAAYCLRADEYPYSEMCDKQQITNLNEQLLERAQLYNKNHTARNYTCDFAHQECRDIISPQIENER